MFGFVDQYDNIYYYRLSKSIFLVPLLDERFSCFPATKRSAGNNMLLDGSELSFFTENIRKKFIIVIQCAFKGSQNTSLDNKKFL